MNTPIYDYIKKYAASGTVRGHMPGHKGRSPLPELEALYSYDITEIWGADSLFEAGGIIAES
ncbi:MAG: amino acid decarboxylase, partial [Ruminococcus sp.]|nr:amino acid decarboxylase [Ruminococcus sp.]